MITYIYHKDSTLWAFEGPEEPNEKAFSGDQWKYNNAVQEWRHALSTARESALPVVNAVVYVDSDGQHGTIGINDYKFISKPFKVVSETLALPGWGLDKVDQYKKITPNMENEWFIGCLDESYSYTRRQAYRLVRSEPEKKRKKSNTLVGDDLLKQFVNKQITLTFYSGKLWHSDKPFPVREHFHSLSFEDNQKLYLNHIKENWLSTAYEVVNPEVIPGMDDYFSGYTKPVDGDQITLPEGYGIEKKEEPEFPGFNHTSYPTFKTVARITRPIEYTDAIKATLSDCPWIKSEDVRSCIRCEGTGETSPDNQCKRCEGTGIEEHQDLCEKPVVEPSESQEETQEQWVDIASVYGEDLSIGEWMAFNQWNGGMGYGRIYKHVSSYACDLGESSMYNVTHVRRVNPPKL